MQMRRDLFFDIKYVKEVISDFKYTSVIVIPVPGNAIFTF